MLRSKKISGLFDPGVFVTMTLIVINAGVFSGMLLSGEINAASLIRFGAQFAPLIWRGEYWRMITAIFLHFNLFHILFNMYALYIFGGMVEPLLGRRRFFSLYLFSGVMGSVLSASFNPEYVSVGASGAVLGLAGAALAIRIADPISPGKTLSEPSVIFLLIFVLYNVIFGFVQTSIDNAAHIGGLASGSILGYYFIVRIKDDAKRLPLANVLYLLFSLLFAFSVLYSIRPVFSPAWFVWRADQLYSIGDMDLAEESYRRAMRLKPKNNLYRRELGRFLIRRARPEDALTEFDKAARLGGDQGELAYLSGVAALAMQDEELLWKHYMKARENGYFNSRTIVLLGNYYALKIDRDNAIDAYLRAIRLEPQNPIGYQSLLYLLTRRGEEENPAYLELLQKEIKTEKTRSILYYSFLGAYHYHFRRFDRALEYYEKARNKPLEDFFFQYEIAQCLFKSKRFKEAEREINLLLASFPDVIAPEFNASINIVLMTRLGILKKLDKRDESISLGYEIESNYQKALGRERSALLLNNLAYHFATENYKIDEALELAQEAALKLDRAYILDTLAWCYYRSGQYQKALETMNRALDKAEEERRLALPLLHLDRDSDVLRPDDGDRVYYYHLASILAQMGKIDEAKNALNRALENHVDFDDYEAALELSQSLDFSH